MKKLLSALCALLMLSAAAAPAYADDHRRGGWSRGYDRGYYDHGRRHRGDDHGDAVAAGIIGLVIGAVIGSAASQPRYDAPPQRYYGGCGPNPCAPPPQPYYEQSYQGGGYYGPQPYQGGYAPEMCTVRERQWDPYAGRTLTIERQVPCN